MGFNTEYTQIQIESIAQVQKSMSLSLYLLKVMADSPAFRD